MAFNTGPVEGIVDTQLLAARVLGMGWLSSVGVAQHLIRELMLAIPKWGAGLPPSRELRKDRPLPGNGADAKRDF
eukprot:2968080-Lingulodinium_polyedra.AAC.1